MLGRELAPAPLERPRRPDHRGHRAAQLVRDERDEVGAQRREAPQLLDRPALGLVRVDVLRGGRDEPAEQREQLDLLLLERVAAGADERQHPDRARAGDERRREPAAEAERDERLLLPVPRRLELAPVDGLVRREHVLEQRAGERRRRARREGVVRAGAGGGHHARRAVLGEDDRDAVEREQAAQLADERAERLGELERRAQRARAAVDRVEEVGAPAELVAEGLRLRRPRLRARVLDAELPDERADDERDRRSRSRART